MGKGKNRRPPSRRSGGDPRKRPPRLHPHREPPDERTVLLDTIDAAIADEHPLALLAHASSLLEAAKPRRSKPFDRAGESEPTTPPLGELLEMFVESGEPQTAALAWVMAYLSGDELSRLRVTRSVDPSGFPRWLTELPRARVVAACQTQDVLRDGTNIVLGVRLGRHDLTLVGFIDYNSGAALKDAFTLPDDLDAFLRAWRSIDDEGAIEVHPLSAADARAWLEPAIEHGERMWPPFESETWPASRSLIEWVLRMCPEGGSGFDRPELTESEQQGLIEDFLRTRGGQALDSPENRSLLDDLMWFGTGYGYGDPLLLSPTKLEILLLDWVPRKIIADYDLLAGLPDLLAGFIPYAHRTRGIERAETESTLAQLVRLTPQYLEAVSTPRRRGAEALLERLGVYDDLPDADFYLDLAAEEVGGRDQLDALDDDRLPDEELDLTGVPDDVHERVRAVADLCDGACAALFDTECRTALRRMLHDVAAEDPQIFRRRGRDETAAAALCWLVGRANTVMAYGRVQSQQLMAHFGLKGSVSQRAEPMRAAIGLPRYFTGTELRSTRYLTSETRRQLIARRDRVPGHQPGFTVDASGRPRR